MTAARRLLATVSAAVLLAGLAACSSGDGDRATSASTTTASPTSSTDGGPTTTAIDRPDGPAATFDHELPAGAPFLGETRDPGLEAAGYVQHEYEVTGTAASYRSEGAFPKDGRFELTAGDEQGDYRTRVLVRRPADAADFNGTVLVEWLNVSGGLDADPVYSYTRDELLRGGYAWVGVSAQKIGIEGGPTAVALPSISDALAGKGLTGSDPARYGDLSHPGDAFAYDLFTQVARALRADGGGDGVLYGAAPDRLLAVGESQSAFALTTYVDGVQPLTRAFDGFLLHSRGGAPLPLGEPGGATDIAAAVGGDPVAIRTDLDVPVFMLQSETDLVSLIGFAPARQDDTDRIRTWEVAGTAHADTTLLGPVADTLACGAPVNHGPMVIVAPAVLHDLDAWVRDGTEPPHGTPIELTADGATVARDADGIALGGVRLPEVEAPTEVLSGDPGPDSASSVICLLAGSSTPMTDAQLAARYPNRAAYEDEYAEASDAAVAAGFVLEGDRPLLDADAAPDRIAA